VGSVSGHLRGGVNRNFTEITWFWVAGLWPEWAPGGKHMGQWGGGNIRKVNKKNKVEGSGGNWFVISVSGCWDSGNWWRISGKKEIEGSEKAD